MQTPDTVSQTTLEWYNDLGAWRDADFNSGSFVLLTLLDALGSQLDATEQYTRDDGTHVGWGQLLDVNNCPSVALPWLAQLPGVVIPLGASDATIRTLITQAPASRRGTLNTLKALVALTLTGAARVTVIERYTQDAYQIAVITYTPQTPDPAATLAAVVDAKPAGLVLTYVTSTGLTWYDLAQLGLTWAQLAAAGETWAQLTTIVPPAVP